jgi:hypothetical protein
LVSLECTEALKRYLGMRQGRILPKLHVRSGSIASFWTSVGHFRSISDGASLGVGDRLEDFTPVSSLLHNSHVRVLDPPIEIACNAVGYWRAVRLSEAQRHGISFIGGWNAAPPHVLF